MESLGDLDLLGACFALFLGSDNSHTTPTKYCLLRKVFCGDGTWLAVPMQKIQIETYFFFSGMETRVLNGGS